MLEAQGISFSYRRGAPVLRDVSVQLEPGSFLAILGVNGCGKSTLLRCLMDMERPDSGRILLDGTDVSAVSRRQRARKVAFVAQHSHANRLAVYDAVLLGRSPFMDGAPSAEDKRIVEEVLGRLKLEGYALRNVDELSGGEYQKVVLARAFVQCTKTLLLDEPTNNLDPSNRDEVMRTVREEVDGRGVAAAAVLHDVNLALRFCDRFLFIRDGRVDAYGGPSVVDEHEVERVYGLKAEVIEHRGRRMIVVL
ncbi:ABC transporter ATP-binding protein [Curtanaerobium respiraculi]|uniref:ABC transporter ATP-binding protein n=1 Tax=Curtanaerobium respiraculi TaxID=2949669 RepID=UPI0024B37471|nr:ABC transporter ATP-binding protein [Curtanaerobium respiraculi]